MNLSFLHFADYAFLTENGKLSIIGIFDRIGARSFPTMHAQMFVVGQVNEITKEESLQLVIKKGTQVLVQNDIANNLQDVVTPLRSYNFIIGLNNFTFPEQGVYEFIIKSGDEEIGSRKLALEKPAEGN